MNQRHVVARLSLIFLLVCAGLMACSGSAPAQSAPAGNAAAAGPEAAFLEENNVAMDRMMTGMDVPPTGDVDRDFARMMIPHHQGAIDMAQALLRHGRNEDLKALARSIIAKQQEEIALMRRIVGEPESGMEDMPPMEGMGGHHHHEASN
jgi:uncharacterized protein (DUF305 family)